ILQSVIVSPQSHTVRFPSGYSSQIEFELSSIGFSANQLRFEYRAEDQLSGALPTGISVQLPPPVNLADSEKQKVTVALSADATASSAGELVLRVVSGSTGSATLALVTVSYG